MNRSHWMAGAAAPATLAALLTGSLPARAEVALGGDFDLSLPVAQATPQSYLSTGAGFDLRLGYRFRIPYQPLWFTPELAAGYTNLSAHLIRLRPGLRISYGRFVVPYAYGHLGWGWASFDPLGTIDKAGLASFVGAGGLSLDAGAGVDFAVLRRLMVGARLGYNVVDVGEVDAAHPAFSAKWMNVGLSATFFL